MAVGRVSNRNKALIRRDKNLTLEIGAGGKPYADTDVAVDITIPTFKPKDLAKVDVLLTPEAIDIGEDEVVQLPKGSQLKVYWVGDFRDMPKDWNGRFDQVKARNSLGAIWTNAFKQPYAVLKKGGKIYFLANAGFPEDRQTQKVVDKEHVRNTLKALRAAGFVQVKAHQFKNQHGEFIFEGKKPIRATKRRKQTGLRTLK